MTDRTDGRRRAGPARPGLLARRQPPLRQLHEQRRRLPRRRVRDGRRRRRHRPPDARCSAIDQPFANHNGGGILVRAGRPALRRATATAARRGDPQRNGQKPGTLLAKLLRIDPTPDGDAAVHHPRRTTPSRRAAAAAGDLEHRACATRGGSPSTPATGDLWIGDVGPERHRGDRPRPGGRRRGEGHQLRLERLRGIGPLQRRPGRPGLTGCRSTSTSTATTAARSPAGSSTAARPSRPSQGAYVFGDYCAAGVRALVADGNQVTDRAVLSDQPGQVVELRHRRDGRALRALARRLRLPARPRLRTWIPTAGRRSRSAADVPAASRVARARAGPAGRERGTRRWLGSR